MTNESSNSANNNTNHFVHSCMNFLRLVRYRKGIVIASVVVSCLLGIFYYGTATRIFESRASILVLQTGADVRSTNFTPEGARQGLMPTYERIFMSSSVLDGAIERLAPEYRVDLRGVPKEKWAHTLSKNLRVASVRNTNVIEVSYRSISAEAAAKVVEAIVASYLEYMRLTMEGAAGEIRTVLTEKMDQTNMLLNEKRNLVLAAKQQVLDVGQGTDSASLHPQVQEALALAEELTTVKSERLHMQATLSAIEAAQRNGGDLKQYVLSLEGEVGRQIIMAALGFSTDDGSVRAKLQAEMLEYQAELDVAREQLGDAHPKIREIVTKIQTTQDYLANYQGMVNEKLAQMQDEQLGPMLVHIVQQRLREAMRHEAELSTAYNEAYHRAIQLVGEMGKLEDLEQEEEWLLTLRDGLLQKISNISLAQDHGNIRTQLADPPQVIPVPVWPRLPIVGLMSLACGTAFGVAIISVLDALDDRFRSPEELEAQLGLPVLAMVRRMPLRDKPALDGVQMHVAPDEPESEAFRTLRTAIAFSGPDTGRIVISSTEPGDGKTTVLANLAVAYARAGKKTLLIDADMRRPGLTKLMDLKTQAGLTQVLQGDEDVAALAESLLQQTAIESLDVLPSGPRQANPAELLAGPRWTELLAWAESIYDQILIDAPPALAAADASIIAGVTDGLVMVIRPEKNRRQTVRRAAGGFTGMGIKPLGVVINGMGLETESGYYSYSEGYGYGYGDVAYGAEHLEERDAEQTTESNRDANITSTAVAPMPSASQQPERPEVAIDPLRIATPAAPVDVSGEEDDPIVPRRAA